MSRVDDMKASSSKGGKTAAANMTKEQRSDRAGKGGTECVQRYGSDFYKHIRQIGINKRRRGE